MPPSKPSPPILDLPSRAAWRAWLAENHAASGPVRVVVRKKGSSKPGMSIADAQEEALCWGWIDSRAEALDADGFILRMSPRQPGSIWSQLNKQRIARLVKEGLLAEPGLAKIRAAQADGSWSQLDDVEARVLPADLKAALAVSPAAGEAWQAASPSLQKQALYWLASTRRLETRAIRLARLLEILETGRLAELLAPKERKPK